MGTDRGTYASTCSPAAGAGRTHASVGYAAATSAIQEREYQMGR
jgi:hypothetical protein